MLSFLKDIFTGCFFCPKDLSFCSSTPITHLIDLLVAFYSTSLQLCLPYCNYFYFLLSLENWLQNFYKPIFRFTIYLFWHLYFAVEHHPNVYILISEILIFCSKISICFFFCGVYLSDEYSDNFRCVFLFFIQVNYNNWPEIFICLFQNFGHLGDDISLIPFRLL